MKTVKFQQNTSAPSFNSFWKNHENYCYFLYFRIFNKMSKFEAKTAKVLIKTAKISIKNSEIRIKTVKFQQKSLKIKNSCNKSIKIHESFQQSPSLICIVVFFSKIIFLQQRYKLNIYMFRIVNKK